MSSSSRVLAGDEDIAATEMRLRKSDKNTRYGFDANILYYKRPADSLPDFSQRSTFNSQLLLTMGAQP